ncbi:hypothetical protein RRG08_019762 [Elysia crispata]|uniref:Uncharacterized protein n=1 Tax=Elysia crispata TaxID=231223 RepID=A0AAE1AY37_9GAST|nr:hypothetical protein RRG08_019762 [Elysia crispata]
MESCSGPTIPDKSSRPDLTKPTQCERNITKSGDCMESCSGPTIPDKSSRPDLTKPTQCERNITKSGDCIESCSGPTVSDKSSRPDLIKPSNSVQRKTVWREKETKVVELTQRGGILSRLLEFFPSPHTGCSPSPRRRGGEKISMPSDHLNTAQHPFHNGNDVRRGVEELFTARGTLQSQKEKMISLARGVFGLWRRELCVTKLLADSSFEESNRFR